MSLPILQSAFNAGELSPELFGRVDLAKYKSGSSTQRNMISSYRGPTFSRPGTAFVGQALQGAFGSAATAPPPRLIPFNFSQTQALVLEFGQGYIRFIFQGGYVLESTNAITAITQGNPGYVHCSNSYLNYQWVFVAGVGGMTELNGQIYSVVNATSGGFNLQSTLTGSLIDTTNFPAYTSGGTVARIYTLRTPYQATDLSLIKWAQSADVMSITHPSYPPMDLTRFSNNNWTLTPTQFSSTISSPTGLTLTGTNSGISTPSFYYQFVMTAVSSTDGSESIASPVATILTVDMATEAATIDIAGTAVTGASSYNFYGSPVSYNTPPVGGTLFGYVGSAFGPAFTDTNITPDYAAGPPLHLNPFAPATVTTAPVSAVGLNYSPIYTYAYVATSTGIGAVLQPIVVNGEVVWINVQNGGEGYLATDTVVIGDGLTGSAAAASITVGQSTGIYPGCVAYFQQRRFYANTTNQPDTYFASQPGSFTNFDTSLPVKDDDSITGTPWSQQVNGIQWMLAMPGGLVILTGLGAWQLSGSSSGLATAAAITPANQVANPQAYNGVHDHIPPIIINYDILYVQAKGSIVRDLSYNFFVNIYTGTDLTVLSNHLFFNHQILEWAWAEEPFKLVWTVRDDGILLCLTYLKEQDVYAWTRHDTNGLFQSVTTVSEGLVNAPYFVVKRLIQNHGAFVWAYYVERMDNRAWEVLEDAWCVDCAIALDANFPNAGLSIDASNGIPTLQQPTIAFGGAHYGAGTYARIEDPTGRGAVAHVTVTSGAITAASISGTLTGFTAPQFVVVDPTAAGGQAVVHLTMKNLANVYASSGVFGNVAGQGEAGDVVRMGTRRMTVTQFISSAQLQVDVQNAQGQVMTDDPYATGVPQPPGNWTIAAPVQEVKGLNHLEGMTVSILADGIVVTPQTVTNGTIVLPEPASNVVVGLGYTAQLQTLYLDVPGGVTVQGRRKKVDQVIVRVYNSGTPFEVGVNQADASLVANGITLPWRNMTETLTSFAQDQETLQPNQLVTGDFVVPVFDELNGDKGQVAVQQTQPVPLTVLATSPWVNVYDDPDNA